MSDTEHHWDRVYATKADSEVSWFQARTATSLELIRIAAPTHSTPIIDVGSGASRLLDGLIAEGFTDITALDIWRPPCSTRATASGPSPTRSNGSSPTLPNGSQRARGASGTTGLFSIS